MAGYSRQSAADIIANAIIKAAPVNAEYNAIRDAFALSGGHKHDGSSTEGAYVPLIADSDALNKVVIDTSNNRIGFFSEVSSSAVEQIRIQDGAILPVTDNDIDLGASGTEFKDLFIDGTATIDTLTVDESATITANLTVNGNTTLGNAATDTVTLTADVASAITPSADDTHDLGAVGSEWRNLYVDGQALIDDLVADTADINGGTIDGAIIGGNSAAAGTFTDLTASGTTTITTADINGGAIDGVTIGANSAGAATFTTVTASGAVVINGGLTMDTNKFTVADTTGNTSIGGTLGVTGAVTANAGVVIDNITIDGTEIDLSSGDLTVDVAGDIILDADGGDFKFQDGGTEILRITNSSSDVVIRPVVDAKDIIFQQRDGTEVARIEDNGTFNVVTDKLAINGTAVTSTATEINILDGDTSATSTTVADADRVVLNDNGTMVQVAVTDLAAYFDDEITAMPNLVTTGALDSGSITSGFGTINTGSSTITTTGNITGGNLIISDGGNIGSASDTDAIAIASDGDVTMSQNLTVTGDLTVSGTTTTVNSTTVTIDDPIFTIGGDTAPSSDDNKDRGIEFRYHTGSAAKVGFFGFDDSTGKFTFIPDATNNSEVFSGTAGTIVANFEGAVTGNASTATALATARNIAGQSFDGTSNISIAPTDLTGVTADANELNILDGTTSATSTGLADADRVVVNDNGTMVQVALTDFETYFEGALDTLSNVTTVGALNAGSITSGFGSINNGSSGITSTGTITYGSLSDGTITVTAFVDEDDMASDSATLIPTQQSVRAYVNTVAGQANNVTGLSATGAQLNTVAHPTTIGNNLDTSTAIANNDAILIYDNSASVPKYFDVDLLDNYFAETTKTLTNKTLTSPVVTGLKLNDAGLTIEGSSANDFETVLNVTDPTADRTITFPDATGTVVTTANLSAITSTGTLTSLTVDDITIDGSTISDSGFFDLNVGVLTINTVIGRVIFEGNSTEYLRLEDTNGDAEIRAMGTDKDIVFKGNDGGSTITALTLDLSEAGAAIFNSTVTANAGVIVDNITIDGTEIDLSSGDLTVDVAGDIILDADNGGIKLRDAGTAKHTISMQANGDTYFVNETNNADILIRGIDGGATITALTLDFSDAGRATFNDVVKAENFHADYAALSGTTPTIDADTAGGFSLTMTGDTTFTFSGVENNKTVGFYLELTGSGHTVNFEPVGQTVKFAGGTAPDAPANGETDILVFITRDGGTTWYGALAIDAAA